MFTFSNFYNTFSKHHLKKSEIAAPFCSVGYWYTGRLNGFLRITQEICTRAKTCTSHILVEHLRKKLVFPQAQVLCSIATNIGKITPKAASAEPGTKNGLIFTFFVAAFVLCFSQCLVRKQNKLFRPCFFIISRVLGVRISHRFLLSVCYSHIYAVKVISLGLISFVLQGFSLWKLNFEQSLCNLCY